MNRIVLTLVAVISIALVAGAVFIGARLLNRPDERGGPGGQELMMVGAGGAGPVSISLDIKPAPELPGRPPEVAGLFVRREDNSVFVGTGEIEISMTIDEAGQRQASSNYSGPVLEVVVTRETTIYRDETKMPSAGPGAVSGDQSIQQVVAPVDSLEDLGENTKNTEIQVWGTRSGDRVVAEVLVYRTLRGG